MQDHLVTMGLLYLCMSAPHFIRKWGYQVRNMLQKRLHLGMCSDPHFTNAAVSKTANMSSCLLSATSLFPPFYSFLKMIINVESSSKIKITRETV